MANLQYVGPRVVPKPYRNPDTGNAEWKSGIEYEALTMVTYLSNGYVSAIPVPSSIGNPAANPDYWVESADFDAALSDLQTRVHDLEEQNGNETLKTVAQTLSGAINELYTGVMRLITIGDSYNTTITPSGGVPIVPWGPLVASYLGVDVNNHYNSGVAGSGFVGDGSANTFIQQLVAIGTSITNKNTITDIIVGGGINDVNTSDGTLANKIIEFCEYVISNYPNAKLWILPCNWGNTYVFKKAMNRNSFVYKQIAGVYKNVRTFNAFKLIHYAGFLQPDGVHIIENGSKALARGIANKIKGGDDYVDYYGRIVINNSVDGATPFTNFHFDYSQNDETVTIKSNLVGNISSLVSGKTLQTGVDMFVGTQSTATITGNNLNDSDSVILAEGMFVIANSEHSSGVAGLYQLKLQGLNVYLRLEEYDHYANTYTAVTALVIYPSAPHVLSIFET